MMPGVDQAAPSYTTSLALSTNTWIEQVTTDIPFIAVGITALAAVTCLLITQRLTFPASCILAAAFLAFNGSIFDFARLLQEAKTPEDEGTFAIKILREVNFSLSIALNYLFFLTFLGRPPRGELKLANVADRARARRDSPSQWSYWGIIGYIFQAIFGTSITSVAVLEIIWRISGNAGSVVYMANGIIQGVLCVAFLGKIFLNTYLSPLSPRWRTARDYLPIILALFTRLGIILASEFCIGFSEAPLGRLLQSIQLYVLIVFSLVCPYYGDRGEIAEKPTSKRASSFRGLRSSYVPRWSALNAAPPIVDANTTEEDKDLPAEINISRRPSPTQRLSSWLNNRLVARKDPQEDRLWNKDQPDLEALQSPGEQVPDDDASPAQAKYPLVDTWRGPYINTNTQNSTEVSTTDAQSPFSGAVNSTNLTTPISAPPKAATSGTPATPVAPIGKFASQFEVRGSLESRSDSPIYGINGIVPRDKRQNSQLSSRSIYINDNEPNAVYQLHKEQAELERSISSLAAFSPFRASYATKATTKEDSGFGRPRNTESGPQFTPSVIGAPSESVKSDFSLRDFPTPPGFLYTGAKQDPPIRGNAIVGAKETGREKVEVEILNEPFGATEIVEDVQFALVPPRRLAAYQRRRASFPAVVRESGLSSLDGMSRVISAYAESEDDIGGKRVRMSGSNNRLDVTSFIGELTTPEIGRNFTPKRSNLRNRNSSLDSGLSPLPEDVSARPSVEIIDLRLKSTTFSPAIAITTGDKSPFVTEAPLRKVTFAPVTGDASNRLRPPVTITPLNMPTSSLRPSGSPITSPNQDGSFKPVISSPLAKTVFSPTSHVPSPAARSKPTYSGYTKGLRPIISGPFPLSPTNENGNKGTRRSPPQRF